MSSEPDPPAGRYDWFGWRVDGAPSESRASRLVETHEYFHRQLDDVTAFGGLTTTAAALADALPDGGWEERRDRLQAMSDLVHESFAVGASLLTTQRPIEPIPGYPGYEQHVRTVQRLLGEHVHPWVALVALRAAAMACMQSTALATAADAGLAGFQAQFLARSERPNHRLVALLDGGFAGRVAEAARNAQDVHGESPWWGPNDDVVLRPEAMDGDAAVAAGSLFRRLTADAAEVLEAAGAEVVPVDSHQTRLRELLGQARLLAPEGLTRIGALAEARGLELLQGGALDGQIIKLGAAPARAVVLPADSGVSGVSGEGDWRHTFVVVTTARRVSAAHTLEGVPLPAARSLAFMRTTVFDGDRRECVLLVPVASPDDVPGGAPVHVSVFSSAAAEDPDGTAVWMRWADPARLSLVMDTPATAALLRWCADGAVFRTQTRLVEIERVALRIIAGRVEQEDRRSALVLVPTTEFGARWFEAARAEDSQLRAIVVDDPDFFDGEDGHLQIALQHLILEERFVGTGSWRS